MRILGSRISVPLGAQSGAFEGANASIFAIELGSHIRRLAPLHKETWGAIDDGCKEAIFTAAARGGGEGSSYEVRQVRLQEMEEAMMSGRWRCTRSKRVVVEMTKRGDGGVRWESGGLASRRG
ncbi:hypothetical protein MRB53_021070 [Persea americana]|uniref:Uncharacterized protein n=1 Tax=Persea americana TaxID=3435 RepID=A0ACC2L407_PERAE|nr:hypothetical protein MRB53_021070 [Persea americana]